MDVLIVGAGAMGTWFGDAVEATVAYADVDPDAAIAAAEATDGHAVALTEDDDRRYDAVCLAVPMGAVADAIEAYAHRAEGAVLDVSGVMEPALEAMATHAPDQERVSLHPLFAPERAPGSIPFVRGQAGPVSDAVLADLAAAGNDLFETTAAEHDEAMETVQAATHAAVLAFALAAEPVPEVFETPVSAQLEALVRTMTGGTPRVYADIQRTFDGAEDVADAAARIAEADAEEFATLYEDASRRWHGDAAVPESGVENAAESGATSSDDGGVSK
ncbi:prephenate dehydrogenase [Halobacteria archaeon AArc-dxtr1]|nr:prephenate dehydrogenase [Halobacteria archaeon AArc-dxtr1]